MLVIPAWMRIVIAAGLCFAAAAVAALYTTPNTLSWYTSLDRPVIFAMPLSVVFFVAIVSCGLMAIASSLMWIHDPKPWDFRGWVPLFFLHLLVLTCWLVLFFTFNVVFLSMLIAFLLSIYVLMLTVGAYDRSKLSFWLLMPYLGLILYFLGMNIAVWVNN